MQDNTAETVIGEICIAGADAARLYMSASGEGIELMPEYYLVSMICASLAQHRAVMLEIPYKKLYEWLGDRAFELEERIGRWKPDIVIFDGGGKAPEDQKMWGFVEVKKGGIDADPIGGGGRRTDRDKLLALSKWFHEPKPHLVCSGLLNPDAREFHEMKAKEKGDRWFQKSTGKLPHWGDEYFFCARLVSAAD